MLALQAWGKEDWEAHVLAYPHCMELLTLEHLFLPLT